MDVSFIWETFLALMPGVPVTLKLTGASFAIGCLLALILALMRRSRHAPPRWLASAYVFVFRGTPLLVLIFLIYYGLGQFRPTLQQLGLWGFFREPYWCAILALSISTSAYGSEIIRGALASVPPPQIEAARAYGMSGILLYRRIILPIAVRQAIPAYGNELILMVKATSLASIITIADITGIAARLNADTFRPIEVFVAAGAVYLLINLCLTRAVGSLDAWLSPRRPKRPPDGSRRA